MPAMQRASSRPCAAFAQSESPCGRGPVRNLVRGMTAPILDLPGPGYAHLFSRSAFAQRKLLDARQLGEAARERGIDVPKFPRQAFERLDSIGALSPVAFSQAN